MPLAGQRHPSKRVKNAFNTISQEGKIVHAQQETTKILQKRHRSKTGTLAWGGGSRVQTGQPGLRKDERVLSANRRNTSTGVKSKGQPAKRIQTAIGELYGGGGVGTNGKSRKNKPDADRLRKKKGCVIKSRSIKSPECRTSSQTEKSGPTA